MGAHKSFSCLPTTTRASPVARSLKFADTPYKVPHLHLSDRFRSPSPSFPESLSHGDETAPQPPSFSPVKGKSVVGGASMGVMRPELVMKSIVPVVMAPDLGICGLIIAVIISAGINPKTKAYYLFDGYAHLSSGLVCGLAALSAGTAIGVGGEAGVRQGDLHRSESFTKVFPIERKSHK